MSWALVCVDGFGKPYFVTDDVGDPAVYEDEDEANEVAAATGCCQNGWSVVELP